VRFFINAHADSIAFNRSHSSRTNFAAERAERRVCGPLSIDGQHVGFHRITDNSSESYLEEVDTENE
jgi:hypothetical protein